MKKGETLKKSTKTEFQKNLGDIIRAYRKKSGLSQEDFAELSGISQSYVAKVEQGKIDPGAIPLYRIEQIANSMDIALGDFLLEWAGGTIEERQERHMITLSRYLLLMPLLSPMKLLDLNQRLQLEPEKSEEIQAELHEEIKKAESTAAYPYIQEAIAKYELHHDNNISPEDAAEYRSMVERQQIIYDDVYYLTQHLCRTVNETGKTEIEPRVLVPV